MESRLRVRRRLSLIVNTIWRWFGTRLFWGISLVLFTVQALYIALFGRFSMAFDEYYHLGTIQQYAKVWLPWSVRQPDGPAVIGSVTTDGSYLYHYVMSFPYRVIEHFIGDLATQVVMLRIVDVFIVVVGFYVFRRLLRAIGMSKPASHALLFIVICIPMTPFLAGQLTYDALFFTLTAVTLLVAVRLLDALRAMRRLPMSQTLLLAVLLLVAAQVKYAYLPIAVTIASFVALAVYAGVRSGKLNAKKLFAGWRAEARSLKTVLVVGVLVLSALLFAVRYGGNIVRYHSPLPKCDAAVSHQRCLAYGPYGRDANHVQLDMAAALDLQDKVTYPLLWFDQMVFESYFAVGSLELGYPTANPLPVPYTVGYVLGVVSLLMILIRSRHLWRKTAAHRLLLSVVFIYTFVLFAENFRAFLHTGAPVAIHGRYLLPLLPAIGFLAYEAIRGLQAWRRIRPYGLGVFMCMMLLSLYAGGITVYIIRSSQEWYFKTAQSFTNAVRSLLWPFVVR